MSTTTTTTTTTTTLPFLRDDEFDDASIAPFWTDANSGGGTVAETADQLQQTMQVSQQCIESQMELVVADVDVYTKVTMPEGTYTGGSPNCQFVLEDWNYGALGDLGIVLDRTGTGWTIWAWTDSDAEYDDTTPGVSIDQNYAWLRLKVAAGVCTAYYSLTEPQYETDWIDVGLSVNVPWYPVDNMDLGLYANPDGQAVNKTYAWEYVREWIAAQDDRSIQGSGGSIIGVVNEGFGGFGFAGLGW